MKALLVIPLLTFLSSCGFNEPKTLNAKFVFFGWGDERIIKVRDFPNIPAFMNIDGLYVDAGYRYKQIHIFFIPVWNYDATWCGYIGSDDMYVPLSFIEVSQQAMLAGVDLPDSPLIPFWDEYGGKLLVGALLLAYIMYSSISESEEDGPYEFESKTEPATIDSEALLKLHELHSKGVLTDSEYEQKKKQLLNL